MASHNIVPNITNYGDRALKKKHGFTLLFIASVVISKVNNIVYFMNVCYILIQTPDL